MVGDRALDEGWVERLYRSGNEYVLKGRMICSGWKIERMSILLDQMAADDVKGY